MSIAWVFPGQGSQKAGMAEPVLSLPEAKERFASASRLMERDLLEICSSNNPAKEGLQALNETRNTQPALFVIESLLVDDLKRQGRQASLVAGHSLGELVALYAADVFDWDIGLKLMLQRSRLMSQSKGGAMTAVMGFDRAQLEELVLTNKDVVIANDNSASQVVLSGSPHAIKELTSKLTCKRAIALPVSGAFHSHFMQEAATEFEKVLNQVPFNNASIPILSNTEPTPSSNGEVLKERLKKQMISGVRWRETMEAFAKANIKTTVEIGPGNVLSNLIKRSLPNVTTSQISASSDLGH